MEYRTGRIARVFTLRFDEGDDLLAGLTEVAVKEDIRCAWFHLLGGLRQGDVVTGPKEPVMPPEPVWRELRETREVLGGGSIFWDGEQPRIHLHAALGHHGDTVTGCVRAQTRTYLVLEVMIIEIAGIDATRPWYATGGFNRLTFDQG